MTEIDYTDIMLANGSAIIRSSLAFTQVLQWLMKRKLCKALRLHDTIARRLGILIVSGKHRSGDLLDTEIAASEQLAVSRSAYREAVRILAAKGLVDARPKVGTCVNPMSMWHLLDPDVLAWSFESDPDWILLDSLFELRKVVGSAAAGFAARRRTAVHLDAMRTAVQDMAVYTLTTERGRQAHLEFHTALLLSTANPYFLSLSDGVKASIRATTIYEQGDRPLQRDPLPDHLRVFEAIASKRAAEAQRAMSHLIQHARIDIPTGKPTPGKTYGPR